MGRIYLDYAASAPLRPEARARMLEVLDIYGNPSSVHAEGQAARIILDESRRTIADLLGVRSERIVFTSGATEANNLALRGVMAKAKGKRLLVSAVEHDCVRNTGKALHAEEIPVGHDGLIDLNWLKAAMAKGDVGLVSVMHANNENGVLQDIEAISALCKSARVPFHSDCVQTVGHVPFYYQEPDLLSFTAHKFGGPRGAGVLVLKSELDMDATVTGGGQERNRRAGTENLLAISGMAQAMATAFEKLGQERKTAADYQAIMSKGVQDLGLEIAGWSAARVEHVIQVLTPGMRGEDVVIGMDMRGVAISQGSACGSGRVKESHVLHAMGYDGGRAGEAVRLSWGWATTEADIAQGLASLKAVLGR